MKTVLSLAAHEKAGTPAEASIDAGGPCWIWTPHRLHSSIRVGHPLDIRRNRLVP